MRTLASLSNEVKVADSIATDSRVFDVILLPVSVLSRRLDFLRERRLRDEWEKIPLS